MSEVDHPILPSGCSRRRASIRCCHAAFLIHAPVRLNRPISKFVWTWIVKNALPRCLRARDSTPPTPSLSTCLYVYTSWPGKLPSSRSQASPPALYALTHAITTPWHEPAGWLSATCLLPVDLSAYGLPASPPKKPVFPWDPSGAGPGHERTRRIRSPRQRTPIGLRIQRRDGRRRQ